MIKVNLANRKRSSVAAAAKNSELKFDSGQVRNLLSDLKELPIKKLVLAAAVCILANIIVTGYKDDQIKLQQEEVDKLNAEKPKLVAEASKIKGLEELKKNMESDEFIIKTKLETINKLMADRSSAARILAELAKISPADVWLTEFELKGSEMKIQGLSLDFARISDFMKNLGESNMFSEPVLKDTQTAQDEAKREVASFNIVAKKR